MNVSGKRSGTRKRVRGAWGNRLHPGISLLQPDPALAASPPEHGLPRDIDNQYVAVDYITKIPPATARAWRAEDTAPASPRQL